MTQRLSIQAAPLFGTPVAETILASVPVRARQQAGHMDASDLIGVLPKKTLRGGGRSHAGSSALALNVLIFVACRFVVCSTGSSPESRLRGT